MTTTNVDRQISGLRDAMIRELQTSVELLTQATVHATRHDYPTARQLARAAADLSKHCARTASLIELLN